MPSLDTSLSLLLLSRFESYLRYVCDGYGLVHDVERSDKRAMMDYRKLYSNFQMESLFTSLMDENKTHTLYSIEARRYLSDLG